MSKILKRNTALAAAFAGLLVMAGVGSANAAGRGPGSSLQITTLDYVTPSGFDLSNKGLTPDLIVDHPRGSQVDEAMAAAVDTINKLAVSPLNKQSRKSGMLPDAQGSQAILGALAVAGLLVGIVLFAVFQHQRDKRREQQQQDEKNKK
jgi:hypothetical protein